MTPKKHRKLIPIGDEALTPEVVLHMALERADELDGVVVLMLLKEGDKEVEPRWSGMKLSDLVFAEKTFSLTVSDVMLSSVVVGNEEPEEPVS